MQVITHHRVVVEVYPDLVADLVFRLALEAREVVVDLAPIDTRELRTADETSAPPEPTSPPAEEAGTPNSPTVAVAKDVTVSEEIAGQPVSSQDITRSERPKPAQRDAVESDAAEPAEPAGPQAEADPSEKDTHSPSADEGAGDDDHEAGEADAGE